MPEYSSGQGSQRKRYSRLRTIFQPFPNQTQGGNQKPPGILSTRNLCKNLPPMPLSLYNLREPKTPKLPSAPCPPKFPVHVAWHHIKPCTPTLNLKPKTRTYNTYTMKRPTPLPNPSNPSIPYTGFTIPPLLLFLFLR